MERGREENAQKNKLEYYEKILMQLPKEEESASVRIETLLKLADLEIAMDNMAKLDSILSDLHALNNSLATASDELSSDIKSTSSKDTFKLDFTSIALLLILVLLCVLIGLNFMNRKKDAQPAQEPPQEAKNDRKSTEDSPQESKKDKKAAKGTSQESKKGKTLDDDPPEDESEPPSEEEPDVEAPEPK